MKKRSALLAVVTACLTFAAFNVPAQDDFGISGDAPVADDDGGGFDSNRFAGDRRFYVSPMFSYSLVDQDRATKDGLGATLSVGKRLTAGLNMELTGIWNQMDDEAGLQTAELKGVGIGALVSPLTQWPEIFGVFALHYGVGENHPTNPPSQGFSYKTTVFDSGLGYLMPMSNWLGGYDMYLRGEARYRMDAHTRPVAGDGGDNHFYDWVFNVGLLVPLGDLPVAAQEEVAVVEPAAPTDADGDGIADDVDQCPDTPAGTAVDDKGCEADSDADGVVDRLDTCPDTAAGAAVNEQGCVAAAADSDGDGVPDDQDKCPDTPAGTAVDATGCPQQQAPQAGCRQPAPGEPITLEGCATGDAIVLRGVSFDFNSSRLTANARVILNQVADALIAAASLKVEIGGHTDSIGSDAYNGKLSDRRARSVNDYLVARGVAPSRMSTRGYGEAQPVASNDTDEGREINRRVEMKIVGEAAPAQ